ncbi:MerR family transcriptional regulator [Clostridium sp. YIM B02551]|uniref:MerR family transcriptional regulator n=1 Tax=Clostridium sp. YIM B02551 TaxID=2910679 RepID=UPI001EEA4EC0|nr:MerR family transcriptional regulator [Clostridium sp. YIM B02551]
MNQREYSITEFANEASVSTRTLRYYDKIGLLKPSKYNKLGYRMYTNKDLERLQYILALKFLGFSLTEVKLFIKESPGEFENVLLKQKLMMQDKKMQIEKVISAIEETEKLFKVNKYDYKSITKVIEAVQMELKPIWMNQYLTTEQREYMRDLAKKSYSEGALQKLAVRGWTEESQKNYNDRYKHFRTELKKIIKNGVDPASQEAQAVGQLLYDINNSYIQDDPDIREGMKKSWENFNSIPDDRKPEVYKISEEEREYIKSVMTIFYKNRVAEK